MNNCDNKKLIIIGASGHGRVVADIATINGYSNIVFLDDNKTISECGGYPVVGNCKDVHKLDGDVVIAIGNSSIRKRLQQTVPKERMISLIHTSAIIANDVVIGAGTVVMPGAIINPGTVIGRGCIINTGSTVDHDCIIGDFVHVAVGSHICGTVTVGDESWIGAGVTIINNISICGGCTIGAGAVVVNNLNEVGTYVGIPARSK